MCLFYLYATAKIEIQICSNKHETGLVVVVCATEGSCRRLNRFGLSVSLKNKRVDSTKQKKKPYCFSI